MGAGWEAGTMTRVTDRLIASCLFVTLAGSAILHASPPSSPLPDATPFAAAKELSVEALTEAVLTRNPTVAQAVAAWQAASAKFPQVTALDDPMFGGYVGPASIGSRDVDFAYRLEVSQKYPFPGKRALRGDSARAEASA